MGVILRPFKTGMLNFLRSLSDLCLVAFFFVVQLCDSEQRGIDQLDEAERSKLDGEYLQERANQQKLLGYVGISL